MRQAIRNFSKDSLRGHAASMFDVRLVGSRVSELLRERSERDVGIQPKPSDLIS